MKSRTKKSLWAFICVLLLVSGTALAQHSHDHGSAPSAGKNDQALRDELRGKDGKQAMAIANAWREKNLNVTTFVTPEDVHFKFIDGKEVVVPLPKDQMVVSIAPYMNQTHKCSTHYMSKCDAELKNTAMKIKAVNASGKVLMNKTVKTMQTGFYDLWLPRDREVTVFVSALGKSAKGKIATYRDSKTCYTTFKLE